MCGIFGYTDPNDLDNYFFDFMKHRGPDAKDKKKINNWKLGHLRLSIIDTSSSANQPYSKDGSILVYNGEIYNYLELKKKYLSDQNFDTSSDTEVLIKLLNKFGLDILNELNGMFAFAYLDSQNKLFLVRDRFGVKPLYFSKLKETFRFGSTLQAIIANKGINLELSPKALHMHFSLHAVVPAPDTIFKNIKKVPPGYYVIIDEDKKITMRQYWKLETKNQKDIIKNENEAIDLIKDTLQKSVEKRLAASDIDVGVLLSGG